MVDELSLSDSEKRELAIAYTFERETADEVRSKAAVLETDPERIPTPGEIIGYDTDYPDEQKLRPLRCQAGSATANPCPREATVWTDPDRGGFPACQEHARMWDLFEEVNDWGVTEEITGDWLRVARAWQIGVLEDLAEIAHDKAKENLLKSEAEANLAEDIADAPRKADERPDLTPEQDEKIRRLMRRTDAFTHAYTVLEDLPEEEVPEEARQRTLAVLVVERDRAEEETQQFMKELGLRPA